MQPAAYLTLLLVATVAVASPSQPEQAPAGSQAGEYSFNDGHHYVHEQTQPAAFLLSGPHHPAASAPGVFGPYVPVGQPANGYLMARSAYQTGADYQHHQQPQEINNHSPVIDPAQPQPAVAVVESSPHHQQVQPPVQAESAVRAPVQPSSVVVETHHQQVQPIQPPQQHHSVSSYYSPVGQVGPVGVVQGVAPEQQAPGVVQSGVKPQVQVARSYEQYGQPESAALPPNYKPFGSWGLYIGGNPADGYYTNYYKALSNSVNDKPSSAAVEPPAVKPAFSPILRQASSSPYVGGDFYPFAYSPGELNSGSVPPQASPVPALSPVQAGAQVYGAPTAFDSNYGVSAYADSYATKKVGAAYAQKEVTKEAPVVQQPAKGYQSRVYVYPTVGQLSAPVVGSQQQVHQAQGAQVVAYPVPIGSQIVGSQAGVDGAFTPYGVHAFTRYAVKPTVVPNQDSAYYYGVHQPAYRHHQQVYSTQASGASYYPLSYYGYPLSQLHYSQGSLFPASVQGHVEPHHGPVQPQVEGVVVEKIESEDKNKQQKKA